MSMTAQTETPFLTYWRELDAALIAEAEAPATQAEAAASVAFGFVGIAHSVGSIIRKRIAAAFAQIQKAA